MVHEITYRNVVAMAYPAEEQAKGCKKVGQAFTKPVKSFVNVAGMSVESTNALDKTCKFIVSILRIVYEVALSVFKVALGPLKLIWEELSAFTGLFGGLNVIGRFGEWLSKGKSGKSFGHPSNNTRAKVTSRALLTVAHGIEGGIFLQTYGLANFSKFFNFLGRIPVLGLIVRIPAKIIKDAFVLVSAAFGIWASFQSYNHAKRKATAGLAKDNMKLVKWTNRKQEIQKAVTVEDKYKEMYNHVKPSLEKRHNDLYNGNGVLIHPDDAKKAEFYIQVVKKLNQTQNADGTFDEDKLNKLVTAHTIRLELKERLWIEAKGYDEKENVRRAKVKTWVSVAYDIAKICITATMIIGWIVGCSTALGFILTAATIGLVSNGLGWGKVIADAKNGEKRAQVADFAIPYISKQTYLNAYPAPTA